MQLVMNATAKASTAPITGPKLDNRRVLAAIVDVAIVAAGTMVILFAADALSSETSDIRGALSAVILGWALYYYFALESGDGQTVGKKLLKLRVVRADGRPAGMREIAVRTVLRVVDGVGGYIVGLIVMLGTGKRRQRLGDLAAGTIVVDAAVPSYPPPPPPPVEAPVVDAPVEDDAEHDSVVADENASVLQTPTITLPSRPAPPATVEDLSAPEAPPVPEMRPFDPPLVKDEPVVEAAEPVEDEVVTEPVEDEVVDEPVAEVELAHDVAGARTEPVPGVQTEVEDASEDEPDEDEPMTVKSVETVSAIDLVMGGAPEEDASAEQDPDPEPPAAS
jgi:uncharacterized RDD family membrane protein YckC